MDNNNCSEVGAAAALACETSINYQFKVLASILGVVIMFWLSTTALFLYYFYKSFKRLDAAGEQRTGRPRQARNRINAFDEQELAIWTSLPRR